MALADELTALVAHAGRGVLDDATSFGAALDDYVSPEAASRGVLNLLVDAVRQGALARLLRDIAHGGDPARAVIASGDQLARDRAATDAGPSRWAVALLGYAVGAVDRHVLDAQAAPDTAAPPVSPPPPPLPRTPPTPATPPTAPRPTAAPAAGPPPIVPLAAPPAWAPPGAQAPARRRTGRVVGAVLLAVVVIAGGIVAAVVLTDDPPRARTVDDPTIAIVTSEGTATGGADRGSDGLLDDADPVAITTLLTTVATESFPGGGAPSVSAQSWSVAPDNLESGFPRELAVGERDDATSWTVRTEATNRTFTISVEHEPSDAGKFFDWSCDSFTSGDDFETECNELTTSDGRAAFEYWYRYPSADIASHNVAIPSDIDKGIPQVIVGERLDDPAARLTLAQFRSQVAMSANQLLEIAEDRRLQLPRPDPTPPLPSHAYCLQTTPRPRNCPDDIT